MSSMPAPSAAKPELKPDAKPETNAEAKAAPNRDAEARHNPEAKTDPTREGESEPKPEAAPMPQTDSGAVKLLNTSLGDLLVAGIVKDPENAGRMIAAAITQANGSIAAAKANEGTAEPKSDANVEPDGKAGPRPRAKALAPSPVTPKIATSG